MKFWNEKDQRRMFASMSKFEKMIYNIWHLLFVGSRKAHFESEKSGQVYRGTQDKGGLNSLSQPSSHLILPDHNYYITFETLIASEIHHECTKHEPKSLSSAHLLQQF